MTPFITVSMLLVFALGMLLLWHEGLLKNSAHLAFAVLFMLGAVVIRSFMLDFESDDYLAFLAPWTQFFRDNGGFKALGLSVGNYNLPYLYFLALFSYINISELYLIKLLSIVFDVLLAWACMKLASLFVNGRLRLIICFFAVLLCPTVVINGAYWAQCDSIYTFFAVFALYLALNDKPVCAMVSIAASFAFKLQAVFVMPVFFVLLVARKIKFKHLFVFPAAYIAMMLPALLAGRPLWDTLTLYFSQAGTVGDAMNYNAPSLTSMFAWSENTRQWSTILIAAAFAFMLCVYAVAVIKRRKLDNRVIFGLAVLLAAAIPYLLPHMHDRYFYAAGMLCIVLAFTDTRFFIMPILAELASLHCYYAYFIRYYLVQPRIGGELMLAVLVMAAMYVAVYLKNSKNNEIYP